MNTLKTIKDLCMPTLTMPADQPISAAKEAVMNEYQ